MKSNCLIILLTFTVLTFSCEDFMEQDISKHKVHVNMPSDNLVTELNNITFWWDSMEYANSYNVQIVSKSFEVLEQLILDSNTTKTKINMVLDSGTYEWRVCAMNQSYEAYSDTFLLKVVTKL